MIADRRAGHQQIAECPFCRRIVAGTVTDAPMAAHLLVTPQCAEAFDRLLRDLRALA